MFSGLKGLFRHEPRARRQMTPGVLAKPPDHAALSRALLALKPLRKQTRGCLMVFIINASSAKGYGEDRSVSAPRLTDAALLRRDATWMEEAYG